MKPITMEIRNVLRQKRTRFLLIAVLVTGIWWVLFRSADKGQESASTRFVDVREDQGRADKIRNAYLFSWKGYEQRAFGFDELLPVTGKGGNSLTGWGATITDGLTTAIMMELTDVVRKQLQFISKLDFTRAGGGMLSAYDLLKGPYQHLLSSKDKHLIDALLVQSKTLANILKHVFDTSSGIPHPYIEDIHKTKLDIDPYHEPTNSPAGAGSLILEWMRLSDISGNPEYGQLARKAMSHLVEPPNPNVGEPYPGLIGTQIRIKDGRFTHGAGGWGAESDSFYEYLLKIYVYDPSRFAVYKDRWILAAESTMEHLATKSPKRQDLTFIADFSSESLIRRGSHLACFAGGNFILGGEILNRTDFIDFGISITKSCHTTYIGSPTGLGPEKWSWSDEQLVSDAEVLFETHGFYVQQWEYRLRPEVIESYYYAYVSTGNQMYKAWAWDAFQAIEKHCKTKYGYSSIRAHSATDVVLMDMQESFWFAETLKYLYLIFIHDDHQKSPVRVEKGQKQKWVFSTEAHPLKVRA